jgi:hypothetical protein
MRVRAAVAIVCVLTLAGCKLNTDYFKDYRGKNLLSSWDFGTIGKWALESYSDYATSTSADYVPTYVPGDYMTWAPATDLSAVGDGTVTTLSVGPDNSSPAYRLEIKNLFKDGDFESATNNATISDSWWSVPGPATAVVGDTTAFPSGFTSAFSGNYLPIDSKSLFFSGTGSGNQITLTLDTTSVPALWARKGGYRFRFDYRYTATSPTFHVKMPSASNLTAENSGDWNTTGLTQSSTLLEFSHFFTIDGSGSPSTITLGSSSNQDEAVIDNVRLIQNDIPPYVTMSFPSLKSGSLQLLPGSKSGDYKLSFWVHDDPTADQTNTLHSSPSTNLNRMEPSGITVQVTAAVKSGSGTFKQFIPRLSSWSKWTQVVFSMGFDFVNSDSDIPSNTPALQIEIAPTNTADLTNKERDAGSVLITQPSFTFNP